MITEFFDIGAVSLHDEFQAWRTIHQDGIFLTLANRTRAILHGTRCQHLGSGPPYFSLEDGFGSLTTKRKVCGPKEELLAWATENGVSVERCRHCLRDKLIDGDSGGPVSVVVQAPKPSSNYVAYHSEELMGAPLGSGPPYGMLTRKAVSHLLGQHVWVIEGRGRKKKEYVLKFRFVVDSVDEIDSDHFRFRFSGQDGIDFTPEIPLSPLPWFKDFLKAVANFSIGVSTLKPEYNVRFLELANLRENQPTQTDEWQLTEGEIQETLRTLRSRSSAARQACISHHGTRCAVCRMDFGETYGPQCTGYIEVHHRNPLAALDGPRSVNPSTDLVPVCPNCHRAAHLLDTTVEDLRRVWKVNQDPSE